MPKLCDQCTFAARYRFLSRDASPSLSKKRQSNNYSLSIASLSVRLRLASMVIDSMSAFFFGNHYHSSLHFEPILLLQKGLCFVDLIFLVSWLALRY